MKQKQAQAAGRDDVDVCRGPSPHVSNPIHALAVAVYVTCRKGACSQLWAGDDSSPLAGARQGGGTGAGEFAVNVAHVEPKGQIFTLDQSHGDVPLIPGQRGGPRAACKASHPGQSRCWPGLQGWGALDVARHASW